MANSQSSDYYDDDPDFIAALQTISLPGDAGPSTAHQEATNNVAGTESSIQSSLKRRHDDAIREAGTTTNSLESEDIYGASAFEGFDQYMRRKRAKLQVQNAEIHDAPRGGIFTSLIIYINGYTTPSVQNLRSLIVKHGGIFEAYLTKKSTVTHVITCTLTAAKMHEFQNVKLVRPEWLVESDKHGVLLPWQDFAYQVQNKSEASQGKARNTQLPFAGSSTTTVAKHQLMPGYAAHASNLNAQKVMANSDWRAAHTSASSNFIEGYYKNSRLHHLSTWKAELKQLVQEAHAQVEKKKSSDTWVATANTSSLSMRRTNIGSPSKGSAKGKEKAPSDDLERVYMHCDFDCFFVAAGLTKRPELRGKPVVVCHSQGAQGGQSSTSEIASASYEARAFGVKNGMSLQQARTLCPEIVTIPYEFQLYMEMSLKFYAVLMERADDLEAVSVDEALIDVTSSVKRLRDESLSSESMVDPAKAFAETIRDEIRQMTDCQVSIGISHNIFLARLATRKAKPAGSYHLLPNEVESCIAPLTICDLRGFGRSIAEKAQAKFGTTSLVDLQEKSRGTLSAALGKVTGETLYNYIRGVDHSILQSDKPRKSVSCEINYGIRFEDSTQAESFIHQMAEEVARRLEDIKMLGRSITLKIMKRDPSAPVEPPKFMGHGLCNTFNKQTPLAAMGGKATAGSRIIGEHACRILRSFSFDPKELRGLGIQIQKLEPLFGAPKTNQPKAQGQLSAFIISPSKQKPPFSPTKRGGYQAGRGRFGHMPPPAVPIHKPPEKPIADLPNFSQVDFTVFHELPASIQKELDAEYRSRTRSPRKAHQQRRRRFWPLPRRLNKHTLRRRLKLKFFPRTGRGFRRRPGKRRYRRRRHRGPIAARSEHYSRVAGMLARSPTKGRQHAFPLVNPNVGKRQGVTSMQLSDDDLRSVGIDPEVLAQLPKHIRYEQLVRARLLKNLGKIPEVSSQRKIIRLEKRETGPVFRLPPPQSHWPQPAVLRQQGPNKGEKLKFTEAEDIQGVIEKWVERYKSNGPGERDIEFFSKFLVKCVEGKEIADDGMEKAVAILKWWLILLRRSWGNYENDLESDSSHEGNDVQRVGRLWWAAFRKIKAAMDVVVRKRIGGKLSLR